MLPCGLLDKRHRNFRIRSLGLNSIANRYSKKEIDTAAQTCRFELWPIHLRIPPYKWVFVDVGANVGDFTSAVLKLVLPEYVIAIEPLPSCHAQLKGVLKAANNSRLVEAAAGEATGEINIRLTCNNKMSSVLSPLKDIEACYSPGDYSVKDTLKVNQIRIDDAVPRDRQVGLLKMDVQGYELRALRGAEATLARTSAILIEINYVSHYDGAVGFNEVHEFLAARGFQLHGVSAPYFGNGRPLWADAIYSRCI
jgi:FkbM family methyltransferase